MPAPDPLTRHPIADWKGTAFLKAIVDHPLIEVGDYSYYDDSRGPEHFVARCVRYHFDFIGDRLIIGKFVAIASGVQFMMNGANHAMAGFSTYPFQPLGFSEEGRWTMDGAKPKGDTVVGNDVWIGRDAVIMPGVRIGDGAIVGTAAVVAKDVPPYGIVVGNPARLAKRRFDDATIERLLRLRWWDWPAEAIGEHHTIIMGGDLDALEAVGRSIADKSAGKTAA